MSLRRAGPGDLELLRRWDEQAHVVASDPNDDWQWETELARCFGAPGVSSVLVDPLASNPRAHRFYERLGFRFVERRRFGKDDCFVYRLDRLDPA